MNSKLLNWLKDHPIMAYYVLACAISWVMEIPLALSANDLIESDIPFALHYLAAYGPLLAAIIMSITTGGTAALIGLFKGMLKWRVKPVWWLVALAPLGIYFVAGGFLSAFVGIELDLGALGQVDFLPGLGLAALPMWVLTFGIGEEAGWRGFVLPRLQKNRSPLAATIILWVLWALWHIPLFFYSYNFSILPGFLVGLLAGAIIFTWLYNGTDGSILLVAVWHGTFNLVTGCTSCKTGAIGALVSTAVMVWAALLVVHYRQKKTLRGGKNILPTLQ